MSLDGNKMALVIYMSFVFVLFVHGNSASDDETFKKEILNRVAKLEDKNALQDETIATQQRVIEKLTSMLFRDGLTKEGSDTRQMKRFVLNSGEGPIGFTAAIQLPTLDHVGVNQTIVFETIVTDIGGGYNNSSGEFVAPLSGIYMFSCSLLDHINGTHGGDKVHADIVQNDKVLGRVFAHADTTYRDQGAQTVITKVNIGDRVFIRSVHNKDVGIGGNMFSTFSGYMLMIM